MHPALIILPAAALILGPRIWVRRVMDHYDVPEDRAASARDVAREMLDRHGLYAVAVERTDLSDHFDPEANSVRLSSRTFDNTSLTAITIAAHEVAHAQQHASGYAPLAWRENLVRVARITGVAGSVIVVAVPLTALLTRQRLPLPLLSGAAIAMLGTGAAAQLAALPTELDASFSRAVPMLRQGYISEAQVAGARRILFACSLTYAASSFVGLANIWPWVGRGSVGLHRTASADASDRAASAGTVPQTDRSEPPLRPRPGDRSLRGGVVEAGLRRVLKPLLRRWLEVAVTNAQH